MDNNKRTYRQLDDTTKKKISQSLKGKGKSFTHAQAISKGLKDYWATIPNKPTNNNTDNTENSDEQNIRITH
ncbi:hypothetical protein M2480_001798 [Parabacteroides sp. PFB2-12]|uniref:hypothetical protein n=1 Tax=unclassified Parabacteroides TaxID=2649774 RepID=UPI002472F4E3|nr:MULTISPECIES: hypothetical protein [unclassified Parabacteroides]MDH6343172.1 hypothetical protein [Parabacteroides sp. PM6-13]MDH6390816.1 hypothetical protein [Parabacteroides sp. PFB2-12]